MLAAQHDDDDGSFTHLYLFINVNMEAVALHHLLKFTNLLNGISGLLTVSVSVLWKTFTT